MRGAFVVQVRSAGRGTACEMEGSVEEVDTGKQSYFRSEAELMAFLRERLAAIRQSVTPEGKNEHKDYHL